MRHGLMVADDERHAFSLVVMDDHRQNFLRGGMAANVTVETINCKLSIPKSIVHQPDFQTSSFRRLFRDSFYNYTILAIQVERLSFIEHSSDLFTYCVACPRPSEPGPLFLSGDGIFGLSRYKNASLDISRRESELGIYFIQGVNIRDKEAVIDEETEPCSNFDAAESNVRYSALKSDTGLFGCCCARHQTPLLYISMTTGERFDYFDAILNDLLRLYGTNRQVFVYYDIACKYSKNFVVQ